MNKYRTRKAADWWLPILVLAAIACLPFLQFFSGKTLDAADTLKSIPFMRWSLEHLAHGSIGQWIPYLFGGMPAYASLVTAPVNPPGLLMDLFTMKFLFDGYADPIVPHMVYLFILGVGSWLYLREEGLSPSGALLLAGLMISMTSLVGLAGAGHTVKL